jgi:3',5'-cyclic-AMP phosphodiesterase
MSAVRLVQISDTHLLPAGHVAAPVARAQLWRVLGHIAAGPAPAALLATGDLADLADAGVYAELQAALASLAVPVLALAGNHDDPALLRQQFPGSPLDQPEEWSAGDWSVLTLNSHQPGQSGGRLGPLRLEALRLRLAAVMARHVLVALHHPPVAVGSPWLDAMGCADGDEVLDCLAADGRVRCVVWGHIHQPYTGQHRGLWLHGTPATRIQFLPRSEHFGIADRRPGFRWINLMPTGAIETGVVYLPATPEALD